MIAPPPFPVPVAGMRHIPERCPVGAIELILNQHASVNPFVIGERVYVSAFVTAAPAVLVNTTHWLY